MRASDLLERGSVELGELPFARALQALATHGQTLAARVMQGSIVKRIVFEDGGPVDCRSNLAHETLSRFMVQLGKLDRERETELLKEAADRGQLFGEVACEAGIVTPPELFRILQQNLAKKLLDLFTWQEGTLQLQAEAPAVDSPLRVKVPQLILTGCTRFVPRKEIERGVGHLVGQRVGLHPELAGGLAELHLTGRQKVMLESLGQPCTLSQLSTAAATSLEDTARFAYALLAMDLLLPEARLQAIGAPPAEPATAPTAPASPPPAPADAAPAVPSRDPASVANDVMTAYLRHRRVDALGLLGVPEDVSAAHLRQAFLRFSERFAPWAFRDPELSGLADKAEELFFAGIRAYAELTDTQERAALPRRRETVHLQIARRAADELALAEPQLLDPEKHFAEGRQLREEGSYAKALQLLELASRCDPQNGEYRAEAAWCWYLSSPGTGASLALEQLQEAMRIDPECGLAVFYYGEILRQDGEWDAAEEPLRRAIKMLAPDRRPIESLRALAQARKGEGDS